MKRKDYISWDQYFMGSLLFKSAVKDPNTQVALVLLMKIKE